MHKEDLSLCNQHTHLKKNENLILRSFRTAQ